MMNISFGEQSVCNLWVDWSFDRLPNHVFVCRKMAAEPYKLQQLFTTTTFEGILVASLYTHWKVDITTNSSFIAIVHERWHCRLHKEYHEVSWRNTLTCQWCALVTLSAGFVSVDGFSNKPLADPAPMLKTKGMHECQTTDNTFFCFPIIAHI